jgi:hypothetical protein
VVTEIHNRIAGKPLLSIRPDTRLGSAMAVSVFVLFTGCISTARALFERDLKLSLGTSIEHTIRVLGQPTRIDATPRGDLYVYPYDPRHPADCTITWLVREGIIVEATHTGPSCLKTN